MMDDGQVTSAEMVVSPCECKTSFIPCHSVIETCNLNSLSSPDVDPGTHVLSVVSHDFQFEQVSQTSPG